jgi:hypothetical protein
MEELINSGKIVDLMLAFVVLEVAALLAYRYWTGRGIATIPLLSNVGAGVSLMVALRAQLTGDGWVAVAGFLLLSLVFHTVDLVLRWRLENQRVQGA